MSKGIDRLLVDEAMDAYIDWREECARVWDAYDRCVQAPAGDAALTFSAYRAALDREECASRAYAQLVTRIVVAKRGARFRRLTVLSTPDAADPAHRRYL